MNTEKPRCGAEMSQTPLISDEFSEPQHKKATLPKIERGKIERALIRKHVCDSS